MVGGLRCVVIHVKCDPNRLRGYGAVEGRKWPFPITLAYTTVQAVINPNPDLGPNPNPNPSPNLNLNPNPIASALRD